MLSKMTDIQIHCFMTLWKEAGLTEESKNSTYSNCILSTQPNLEAKTHRQSIINKEKAHYKSTTTRKEKARLKDARITEK